MQRRGYWPPFIKKTNQILMKLEREPDSDEIEEMEEEVEEYAVTGPLSSSNSMQLFLGRLPLGYIKDETTTT